MGNSDKAPPAAYQQQFDAPGSLQEDSGDDDDEEDIGKDPTPKQNALDYDSDEKEEVGDGAQQELISLDGGSSANNKRKKVPKLKQK